MPGYAAAPAYCETLHQSGRLNSFPERFPELLAAYCAQIAEAIEKESHHDHRRALLIDFLRQTFDIEVGEIELEKKVKAAEARGLIDAFYKFVILEVKIDLDSERADATRELKKYFESRPRPEDYVAAVTDGIKVELYDYGPHVREPHFLRSFEIVANDPSTVYTELDELLASGQKIAPTSDDIVARFGAVSFNFLRSAYRLMEAYDAVAQDSTVAVKIQGVELPPRESLRQRDRQQGIVLAPLIPLNSFPRDRDNGTFPQIKPKRHTVSRLADRKVLPRPRHSEPGRAGLLQLGPRHQSRGSIFRCARRPFQEAGGI
jgi:hypothetical protein